MTLQEILDEAQIEFGGSKPVAVIEKTNPHYSQDKMGYKAENQTKLTDVNKLSPITKSTIEKVISYLKKKNLWNRVASKQNFNSSDMITMADGSIKVNFDDGGGTVIPARLLEDFFDY